MTSSSSDAFASRSRALENEFFFERDKKLLANLRHELSSLEEEHKLAHVSGIVQEKVLLDLVRCGVTAESLMAVRMIPMIVVAWVDHFISVEERAAILKAAEEDSIRPGTAPYELLLTWLQAKPRPEVITAWREYVSELVKVSPPESLRELRERTSRLCNAVARCASGFWILGTVSAATQKVIDEFVSVWDQT
ncbi:MAG TPA: hypothetical protein VL096_08440 [Pirellulaceae bacterium]|nr:hypothetical protein [Pirellulaceae bacterium]